MKIPTLPRGRKANIAWTSHGRRLMGTVWTSNVAVFINRRILPGSTDIVIVVDNGRKYQIGDKPRSTIGTEED